MACERQMKKYLCINCKQEFNHIPPYRNNECFSGHTHTFIKSSSIITNEERNSLANAFLLGKKVAEKIL